jgi:lipopolysaccharide export system permease protein
LRFVEMIVNKGLSIGAFLKLTLLLMPGFLVVIIPISLFAVVLFTFNRLISDREMVVMRAAGLSHVSLARPVFWLGGAAVLVGYLLTCWLIPLTVRNFHEMQWTIRNDITNVLLQEGVFNKFGDGLTIYVRSRTPEGELSGILVHDQRTPTRTITLMAERGALVMTETGPRVLMINGNRQEVAPGTGRLSLLYFDSYTVDFATATGKKPDRFRDARERTMGELFGASEDEPGVGPGEMRRFRTELYSRLISPLYNFGYPLMAAAILLTSGFDRRGQMNQLMIAVAGLVAVQAASLGASNLATRDLDYAVFIPIVALLPIVLGLWALIRPLRPRRRAAGLSPRPA